MLQDFFNYFLIGSIIVGFVFISITLLNKKRKDKSIIYLNLVIIFLVLNYLQIVLLDNIFTNANYFVTMLRIPFYALILPAYYTFVTYYLNVELKIKSYVFLSIIIFFIEILARVILYQNYYNIDQSYTVAIYKQIEEIVNILFSLYLFIKAFVLLFKKQKLYQYILSYDNLNWLRSFMIIGTFIMLFWIFAVVFNLNKVLNPEVFIYYPLRFSISFLLLWLAFNGLSNYTILTERIALRDDIVKDNKKTLNVYENTLKNEKFQNINSYIHSNLSYLNPNFSLEKLSDELNMSTSLLSQIINSEGETNFSDYINSLRVKKAKELLASPDFISYTIVSVGLECGFNSKSTFYLAFKKFANSIPTEFRKQNK